MKAAEWIDRLKKARAWDSDYRVAKELDVAGPTLSRYRNKPDSTMDDDIAVKVAEAMDLEPEIILLDQVAERTKSEPARAALAGLLQRIAGKVLSGGGGSARRLDITSVTDTSAAGELQAPRSTRYASYKPALDIPHSPALQLLQRAIAGMLSHTRPLSVL